MKNMNSDRSMRGECCKKKLRKFQVLFAVRSQKYLARIYIHDDAPVALVTFRL